MVEKNRNFTLQQKMGFSDADLKTSLHDEIMIWLDANISEIIDPIMRKTFRPEIISLLDSGQAYLELIKIWEKPITTGKNNYIIGFIDFSVTCVVLTSKEDLGSREFCFDLGSREFCFEVKSKIPSVGELIRQIHLYREYLPGKSFMIVSPDDRFKSVLESQKIGFIKYESKSICNTMQLRV